jgi:hypothetical protein
MATISPMIDSAVSSAVSDPRSSPIGAETRSSSASVMPLARSRSRRFSCARRDPMAPM